MTSAHTAQPTDATSMPSLNPDVSSVSAADATCPCRLALSDRDRQRIAALDPEFGATVTLLLRLMAMAGHRMFVTSGKRTTQEQQALYAQGRTEAGKIVTHLDGVARRSKHQDGVAVDCAFVGPDPWSGPWEMYAKFAEGLGLVSGAHWKKFPDRPHVEAAS